MKLSGPIFKLRIILEEVMAADAGSRYPKCLAGERACPPDDSGGPHGYPDFLAVLSDKANTEPASMHRWARSIKGLKRRFDPQHFDEREVRFSDPRPRLRRLRAAIAGDKPGPLFRCPKCTLPRQKLLVPTMQKRSKASENRGATPIETAPAPNSWPIAPGRGPKR